MLNRPKPVILLIHDGFGYSLERKNNAIAIARTPCWNQLQKDYPMTLMDCSGRSLGLPEEQILVYVCGDKPLDSCGGLSDLAPTTMAILGVEQPAGITGRSLINVA